VGQPEIVAESPARFMMFRGPVPGTEEPNPCARLGQLDRDAGFRRRRFEQIRLLQQLHQSTGFFHKESTSGLDFVKQLPYGISPVVLFLSGITNIKSPYSSPKFSLT
jgi:hypothetical protein